MLDDKVLKAKHHEEEEEENYDQRIPSFKLP